MNKGLDLDGRILTQRREILPRQLARADHAVKAAGGKELRRVGIVPRKLRAAVQTHGGDIPVDQRRGAHIGDDKRVDARIFEKCGIFEHLAHLAVVDQRVERDIALHAVGAAELCCLGNLVTGKILGKGACAEALTREIHRVGACVDRRLERGKAARRGK